MGGRLVAGSSSVLAAVAAGRRQLTGLADLSIGAIYCGMEQTRAAPEAQLGEVAVGPGSWEAVGAQAAFRWLFGGLASASSAAGGALGLPMRRLTGVRPMSGPFHRRWHRSVVNRAVRTLLQADERLAAPVRTAQVRRGVVPPRARAACPWPGPACSHMSHVASGVALHCSPPAPRPPPAATAATHIITSAAHPCPAPAFCSAHATMEDVGAPLMGTLLLMFVGALLCGAAPFFLRMRETHLQTLAALGAGLLIGSALAVIIPEGFHAFAEVGQTGVHGTAGGAATSRVMHAGTAVS